MFCLEELKVLIQPLPNASEINESIDHAIDELKSEDVRELKKGYLHDYIDNIQVELAAIHNGLAELYFLKSAE